MRAERFDALSRLVGARASRRMAVALAATGLLAVTVPEVTEARCSARKPCPECRKCRKHRCKPDSAQNGHACAGGGTCERGICQPAPCLALKADCSTPEQCCQEGGEVDCGPISTAQNQCCRPLGGACPNPGLADVCCNFVNCAANNTCGGTGAMCFLISSRCVSGVCCGIGPLEARCCATGQSCQLDQCIG